jgi:hypothetical protein
MADSMTEKEQADPLAGLRGQAETDAITAEEISSRDARIAVLEHALRVASGKLTWLADYHLNAEYSRREARSVADKLWQVQAGEIHSLLGVL